MLQEIGLKIGNYLTPCHCQTYGVHWYVEDFSGDATTLAITRYV